MTSGADCKPQTKAGIIGRTWSDIVKPARAPDVISRNELLAACVTAKQNDQSDCSSVWLPGYGCMCTESSATANRSHQAWSGISAIAPTVRPALPPGLEPPPGLELPAERKSDSDQKQQKKKKKSATNSAEIIAPEPEKFQVLLQNLPTMMLNECMLRVMLDQAKLIDVVDMKYRPNGKALITFGTYASLVQCISHFEGRQWGAASRGVPISATYVRLVKMKQTPVVTALPAPMKSLSADAPTFVPGLFPAAPTLQQSSDKMCEERDRLHSNASTEPGSADGMSDGCDSDMEEKVPVACA